MLALTPPRPLLSFRVGITGTRDPQAAEAVRSAVAQILKLVIDEIFGVAETEEARVYLSEANDTIQPKFVFVSPLAEGADRVAAEEALRLGYQLKATLPFARTEYENDFPGSVDEFHRLLQHADSVLELDGDGDDRERSYEAVGRFVVNNSDLLIAVWDGKRANGRGGTGDIVELAVDLGVPVVHLPIDGDGEFLLTETRLHLQADAAEMGEMKVDVEASEAQLRAVGVGEPHMIETWLQLHRPDLNPYPHGLRQLIRRTVLPPLARARWGFAPRLPALQKYFQEDLSGAERRWVIFRLYDIAMWLLTKLGGFRRSTATSEPEHGDPQEWWTKSYEPADKLSPRYGARYRSSYVMILLSGFLALVMAALALADPQRLVLLGITKPETRIWFSSFELAALILILVLWACNRLLRWHQRWIGYRLLAELCRKQRALGRLGRSLPRWEIEHLGSEADMREEAWVGWYFTAMARAAPFPCGYLRGDALERERQAGLALVDAQIAYHIDRGRRYETAGLSLRILSSVFFLATLICVVLELVLKFTGYSGPWSSLASILAVICPMVGAFAFGVGAYAEFEVMADQSAHMTRVLHDAWGELEGMRLDQPLASQDLGARIFRAATLMMRDIRGWAQLFRVKHVETH